MMRHAGPYLGAVDDIFIAVAFCSGLERRKVRARSGFRVALTPDIVTGDDSRQKLLLLRLGPKVNQHGSQHLNAHHDGIWCIGELTLFQKNVALLDIPAGATVLDGPFRGTPPLGMQNALPFAPCLEIRKHAGGALSGSYQIWCQRISQKSEHLRRSLVGRNRIGSVHFVVS